MNSAVVAPITSTKLSAVSDSSNRGDMRSTMKMPAVTMVAAWIRAEIGVGPSIESGSQTCNGTCADLPIAPMNKQMQITVAACQATPGSSSNVLLAILSVWAKISEYCAEPVRWMMPAMPSRKPKSPTRLTRNAFMFAKIADGLVYQKPISRYETRPTASQPKKSCTRLFAITSMSIENVNSEM
jgi:hypothetical protein